MRYLRLSGRKRRAHSPLRLRDEARLVIGARVSSRNQQILCLRQQAVRAPMLMCPGTCRRATPATRRSTAHCTWRLIAPTAVPPDVTRPRLATAGPRDTSCETLCDRAPLHLTVFLATARRRRAPNAGCRCPICRRYGERTLETALSISARPHLAPWTLYPLCHLCTTTRCTIPMMPTHDSCAATLGASACHVSTSVY